MVVRIEPMLKNAHMVVRIIVVTKAVNLVRAQKPFRHSFSFEVKMYVLFCRTFQTKSCHVVECMRIKKSRF